MKISNNSLPSIAKSPSSNGNTGVQTSFSEKALALQNKEAQRLNPKSAPETMHPRGEGAQENQRVRSVESNKNIDTFLIVSRPREMDVVGSPDLSKKLGGIEYVKHPQSAQLIERLDQLYGKKTVFVEESPTVGSEGNGRLQRYAQAESLDRDAVLSELLNGSGSTQRVGLLFTAKA